MHCVLSQPKIMRKSMCVATQIALLLTVTLVEAWVTWSDDELKLVTDIHKFICGIPLTCMVTDGPMDASSEQTTTSKVDTTSSSASLCCQQCSCEVNDCKTRDNCCLNISSDSQVNESKQTKQICEQLSFHNSSNEPSFWMFSVCPSGAEAGEDIVAKCEHPYMYTKADAHTPVYDGKYVYRNRFCAMCHGLYENVFRSFEIAINCDDGRYFVLSSTIDVTEFHGTPFCRIVYSVPSPVDDPFWKNMNADDHSCYWTEDKLIDRCNITGHWASFDSLIESACISYTSIYELKYKNVFCFICNTENDIALFPCISHTNYKADDFRITISDLLRFLPEKTPYKSDQLCSSDHVLDTIMVILSFVLSHSCTYACIEYSFLQ